MSFGKYAPLQEYLAGCGQDEVKLSTAAIEQIIGEQLPASAYQYQGWWSNRRKAIQSSAWIGAGYKTTHVDLVNRQITFSKPANRYEVKRSGDIVLWDGDLIKALREYMGLNQARFADELGVRQQTISEWETGLYAPSRANCKYLMLIAERAGFGYG